MALFRISLNGMLGLDKNASAVISFSGSEHGQQPDVNRGNLPVLLEARPVLIPFLSRQVNGTAQVHIAIL